MKKLILIRKKPSKTNGKTLVLTKKKPPVYTPRKPGQRKYA